MNAPTSMRAWRMQRYGGIEAMTLDSMPVPSPGAGQVLVRMRAASINPIDWKIREGYLKAMLPLQFPKVMGRDGAGEIVSVGEGAGEFSVGERVTGLATPSGDGTHAEFAVLAADGIARIPDSVGFAEAASLGVAGLSAFIPLVENAKLASGQRILIHAGAGGVGHIAIQIARHLGAEVITTCSAANAEFCKSLGASRCVDYRSEDFTRSVSGCDVVFDTVGGEVHQRSAQVLKPGGSLVFINAAPVQPVTRTDIRVLPSLVQPSRQRLGTLLDWTAAGHIAVHLARVFAFVDAPAAYTMSQAGGSRGKIAISMP
jgi:NADPH:quinone reductase-like Zn-dependent oxidoreductase